MSARDAGQAGTCIGEISVFGGRSGTYGVGVGVGVGDRRWREEGDHVGVGMMRCGPEMVVMISWCPRTWLV